MTYAYLDVLHHLKSLVKSSLLHVTPQSQPYSSHSSFISNLLEIYLEALLLALPLALVASFFQLVSPESFKYKLKCQNGNLPWNVNMKICLKIGLEFWLILLLMPRL